MLLDHQLQILCVSLRNEEQHRYSAKIWQTLLEQSRVGRHELLIVY